MTFLTALAVAWFITAAVIVAVYLARYMRDYRELRRQEAEYAAKWCASHRLHQDRDRYLQDREGAPE